MIEFEHRIPINEATLKAPNLVDKLSERDLNALGNMVWEGYDTDKFSRNKWERRTQTAMDLAMQIQKDKNFPWPGCSNVAFPLITIATLQFHSRAYPAMIPGRDIARYRSVGPDPDGKLADRASRIGSHMSYQLLEESQSWEEQHDRMLINVPIVGCAFKKTYYSGAKGTNESELVMAQDLVMDYFAKSVEDCARKTHIIPMYRNEIYEKVRSGIYRDVLDKTWYKAPATPLMDTATSRIDDRAGKTPPKTDSDTPFTMLEQHVNIDFDGDGYKEPYIVTIEATSKCVVRVVTRFDRMKDVTYNSYKQIVRITATEYFTKYGFIPSPDGGIYDMGFGVLLGPLNESTNSILNQLVDAGTMSVTAGGFLGRGAKIRGGTYTFAPLEWKRVDSTGEDLHKSIYPLPVREPSMVLFQLLNLLISYTNRISGSTDTMVGENPGQNTPASNVNTMVEQGEKIYSAIFKRLWRSCKEEFKKVYIVNSIYLPDSTIFGEEGKKILREDYLGDPARVSPVADPNAISKSQRVQEAMMIKQIAMTTPGYDLQAVERNFLKAANVEGWEALYPGPDKVQPLKNPKVQIEEMKLEAKKMDMKLREQMFVQELMEQRRLNAAKILQLEAQAAKLMEEAGGVQAGQKLAAFDAAIGAMKVHNEMLKTKADTMLKAMELDQNASDRQTADGK